MGTEALIVLLANLGISVFTQIKGAGPNTDLIAKLLVVAQQIYDNLNKVNATLVQAQAEGWADTDPRWKPVFQVWHDAIAAAEATL